MIVDTTQITMFGIRPYIFFAGIGIAVAVLVLNILIYHTDLDIKNVNFTVLLSLIPLFMGAKILGIVYNLISSVFYGREINIKTFLNSGIVFFGGLLCFLASLKLISRKNMTLEERETFFDIAAIIIPLFHIFGRIGCFIAGCCYGKISNSFVSVIYTSVAGNEIVTAPRIPIQLFEALFNAILCTIIFLLYIKQKYKGKLIQIYLFSYSVIRFVLEFFRDDWKWILPTCITASQIISMIIILFLLIKLFKEKRRLLCLTNQKY